MAFELNEVIFFKVQYARHNASITSMFKGYSNENIKGISRTCSSMPQSQSRFQARSSQDFKALDFKIQKGSITHCSNKFGLSCSQGFTGSPNRHV
jgi:hypothetical protein